MWKIPENTTVEEAAGVSLVALTAAQSVWYRLGLKSPFVYDKDAAQRDDSESPHV